MAERAGGIAAAIGDCPRVAILADRTPTAFAAVLGAPTRQPRDHRSHG